MLRLRGVSAGWFCSAGVVLFFALLMAMLSMRQDSEIVQSVKPESRAEVSVPTPGHVSFFVCLENPESSRDELVMGDVVPDNAVIGTPIFGDAVSLNGTDAADHSGHIALMPPRPLDVPADFARRHDISPRQYCHVSGPVLVRPGEDMPDGSETKLGFEAGEALVIAAVSDDHNVLPLGIVFALFVVSLFGAAIGFYRSDAFRLPCFARYDAPLSFAAAMLLAMGLASIMRESIPSGDGLLPSFGQMTSMLLANFLAFLVTVGVVWAVRRAFPACSGGAKKEDVHAHENDSNLENSDQNSKITSNNPCSNCDDAVSTNVSLHRRISPLGAIGLGIGIALLAVFMTSFMPMPGLTTLEMASQLTTTLYMTAMFAILAGVCEELLFRGVIQTSLEARKNSRYPLLLNTLAVLISSSLFVLLHVPQSLEHLWALLPIALVSLSSGVIKLRSGSIFPSILLHMSYNGLLLLPSLFII